MIRPNSARIRPLSHIRMQVVSNRLLVVVEFGGNNYNCSVPLFAEKGLTEA